jgi:hypothetical protein
MLIFKNLVPLFLLLTVGCASKMAVAIRDATDRKPVASIRVQRERPVSFVEKVFNPVGAFYFRHRIAQTKFTDDLGAAIFRYTTRDDIYRIYPSDLRPLVITAWEQEAQVSPETSQPTGKWTYAAWLEDGVLRTSAFPETQH